MRGRSRLFLFGAILALSTFFLAPSQYHGIVFGVAIAYLMICALSLLDGRPHRSPS